MKSVGTDYMNHKHHDTDLCIIGGGLTGVCAAIAAAREGTKVVLIQDRPVLGGNSSSEVRMWVRGAKGLHNRETGIISELEEENIYRNPTLCPSEWDSVVWGAVIREKNIELILNCSCCDAEVAESDRENTVISVTAWQLTTYTWHTVSAKYFADCSGDSILATLCGADWRVGREGNAEYNERIGPVTADAKTMGMSCLIQARETDHKVDFIPPDWAHKYLSDADFNRIDPNVLQADSTPEMLSRATTTIRDHILGTSKGNFWWIELGGTVDSLHDTEEIRDELLKIAFGIWDHVKNHGDHKADNWELEWVGFLPGKRESRRYIGEYVMTENDIESGGHFADTVAFGGWPMDDHNPHGFYSFEDSVPPSVLYPAPSPYGIPFRVMFSGKVRNLLFAGRNISVTHAALSSTRVMATCSLLGQALGCAASLCVKYGIYPINVYEGKIGELQSILLEQGCYLPDFPRRIPELSKEASLNIGDEERAVLFNGIERPDEKGTVNFVSFEKGGRLTFTFGDKKTVSELRLVFDPDFSRESLTPNKKMRVFSMKCMRGSDFTPMKVAATLCRGFEVFADGRSIFSTDNNFHSLVRIPVGTEAAEIEIVFKETWGSEKINVFSADVK